MPNRLKKIALMWLSLPFWLLACYGEVTTKAPTGSFKVEFTDGKSNGEKGKELNVPTSPLKRTLTITALGADGKPETSYNGSVCVYATRGILIGAHKAIQIKNGVAKDATINLKLAFGKTSVWVGEAGKAGTTVNDCPNAANPEDTTRPYIGRVGAAPDLLFKSLSIQDAQTSDVSPYDSPLFKKYALIKGQNMVVTAVTSNGFYMTDMDIFKKGGLYHSLFVFTFSAPTLAYGDGEIPKTLQVGDIVTQVEGGVDEFSGHTQITFPSFVPKWKDKTKGIVEQYPAADMPKPINFTLADTWSRRKMEPYESALVEVKNAIAIPFNQIQDGWSQFRQWPVLLVQASKPADQKMCEELVRTELYLHVDKTKNKGSRYRSCLGDCQKLYLDELKLCKKGDVECETKATDAWFNCFFGTCRFDNENGLFARFDKAGCEHAILLVITNSTIPGYDPTTEAHLTRRFPSIRGILLQSRASGFYKIIDEQYDNEQSNNGYVIWVRGPDDLTVETKPSGD